MSHALFQPITGLVERLAKNADFKKLKSISQLDDDESVEDFVMK
ncbi:hypothetical protein [Phocaeicola sp.]|jgi:hypothetical protein